MASRTEYLGGRTRVTALAATAAFLAVGALRMFLPDRLIASLVAELPGSPPVATVKVVLYIVTTGILLYPVVRAWRRDVRSREERYHALFDGGNDAIFVYAVAAGQPSRLVEANRVACEWLGYRREELLALTPADISADDHAGTDDRGAVLDPWAGDALGPRECSLEARDGRHIPVEISVRRFDLDGAPMVLAVARSLSDRRRAMLDLAHERDLLHALMDNIPDLIYFKDLDLRFTRINAMHSRVLGLEDPCEAIGHSDGDYFLPEHVRDAEADERRILATREPLTDKLARIRRADGEFRWVSTTKAPICDRDGHVTGIVGISRDITERRSASLEKRVRDSALNSSLAGIVFVDVQGVITYANPSFLRLWGLDDLSGLRGQEAGILLANEGQLRELVDGLRRVGRWVGGAQARRADGSTFDAQIMATVVRGDDGAALAVMASAIDLTEQSMAERALRASEEKYRLLVENANEVIVVVQDGWVRYANRRSEQLLGHPGGALVGQWVGDLVHPDDRELVMERHLARMRNEGYPLPYVIRVLDVAGAVRWVEVSGVAMQWENQPATLNLLIDVTERKLAEDALRESEARFRTLVNSQGEGILEADPNDVLTFGNPAAEAIFGLPPGGLVGRSLCDFVSPDQMEVVHAQTALRLEGQQSTYELEVRRHDGEVRDILVTGTPQTDRDGRFVGTFGIFRDVTERKRAERERERLIAELREALGQVKTLRGLLPICASCKKVRDDGGYWHMVESYVRDHSQAEFTHTLCPDCLEKLYPDYVIAAAADAKIDGDT